MLTPQTESPEIARELGIPRIFFKREDLHPYGSHKGRSIPRMIDIKVAGGAKDFVITGSGNAALAALRHIQRLNAEGGRYSLSIFIGEHMNQDKRHNLEIEIADSHVTMKEVPDPLRALFRAVKDDGQTSLRQSTDDDALVGYSTLASEIAETPDLSAVFVGTSSGTTAQALAEYFIQNKIKAEVHIVQTTNTFPFAQEFTATESSTEPSLADAIVDKVARRKETLVLALRETGGSGWVATNERLRAAQRLLQESASIEASPNGALGLAGLIEALSKGAKFTGSVVCIITGQ